MKQILRILLWLTPSIFIQAHPPGTNPDIQVPPPAGIADTVAAIKLETLFAELGVAASIGDRPPDKGPSGERRGSLGTMRILVVPVKTAEAQPPFDRDYLHRLFFGRLVADNPQPENASVADYYDAASGGRFRVTGGVLDWLTLTNRTDYWISQTDSRFVRKVAEYAHQSIRLAPFDNDDLGGVGAPSQKDGSVDFLAIVYESNDPSNGAYRSAYSWLNGTRGRRWDPPTTSTNRTAIENFIFLPADSLGTDYRIGIPCHEIGHFLGLPDLYRREVQYPTDIGHWDLMCWGCANRRETPGDPFFGSSKFPTLFSAWSRNFLGWGTGQKLPTNVTERLTPARDPEGAYLIVDQLGDSDERIFIEYHTAPSSRSPWGQGLVPATNGFLVWHSDDRVGERGRREYAWPSTALRKGQNDDFFDYPVLTNRPNLRNGIVGRPLLRVVSADGRFDLQDRNHMLVDENDLFTNGKLQLSDLSKGFGLYRAAPSIEIEFDTQNEMVTRKDPTERPIVARNDSPAPAVTSAPNFEGLILGSDSNLEQRQILNKVASQPESLRDSQVKSNFARVPEATVVARVNVTGNQDLLEAHREIRTYSTEAALKSRGTERLPAAKVKAFLGNKEAGKFVTGVWGTNVDKILEAQTPVQQSNALIDAQGKARSLPTMLDLPSSLVKVKIDKTPKQSERRDSTKKFNFHVEAKVGPTSIPLSFCNGSFHYEDNTAFQGLELNQPIRVRSVPTTAFANFPQSKAVDLVKAKLKDVLPTGSKVTAELSLFPTGEDKDQWILAHKIKIDAPRTTPLFTWVNAQTGEFLK